MTQTNKTARADRLRGLGIEGSMSRAPSLGADDPRHRIAADRELEFLQRFNPDDFVIDDEQRVKGTGSFLNHTDTPARYLGSELFFAQVKADGSGIAFAPVSGGGEGSDPGAGGIAGVLTVRDISSDTTIKKSDNVLLCDATSAAFTATLPAAAGNKGKEYNIKKTDATANTVTVAGKDDDVIDDGETAVVTIQYECMTIVSNGTKWSIL